MSRGGVTSLRFAARPLLVEMYVCQMLLVVAVLTVVPALVSAATGQYEVAVRYTIIIVGMAGLGAVGAGQKLSAPLQKNEALAITALMFVLPPLFFTVPLMGYGLGFADAFFEAVSGVTTTGLSVLDTVEERPAAFHFGRAWMQWVGGLGVVVLSLAMLLEPGATSRNLGFEAREADNIAGGTRAHARNVLIVYTVLTLGGVGLLWALGAAPFDALVTSLASISTGGFSNFDASLSGFAALGPRIGAIVVCLLGAVGFYVYYRVWYRQWRDIFRDRQTLALLAACAISAILLYLMMLAAGDVPDARRWEHAALMAVSAQTTAGFSTIPVSDLGNGAQLVLVLSMFLGGGLGSTAGGIKMLRLLMMIQLMIVMYRRAMTPPDTFIPVRLDRRALSDREIEAAVGVILGGVIVVLISWMVFIAYGYDAMASLFEVTSAFGTAGLSAGVSGSELPLPLKLILSFDMLAGRVEVAALVILLFPATWFGKRRKVR